VASNGAFSALRAMMSLHLDPRRLPHLASSEFGKRDSVRRFQREPVLGRKRIGGRDSALARRWNLRPAEGFVRLGERSDFQGISLNGSGAGHPHVFQRLLLLLGLGGAG
jgi:hypothetical protein